MKRTLIAEKQQADGKENKMQFKSIEEQLIYVWYFATKTDLLHLGKRLAASKYI